MEYTPHLPDMYNSLLEECRKALGEQDMSQATNQCEGLRIKIRRISQGAWKESKEAQTKLASDLGMIWSLLSDEFPDRERTPRGVMLGIELSNEAFFLNPPINST